MAFNVRNYRQTGFKKNDYCYRALTSLANARYRKKYGADGVDGTNETAVWYYANQARHFWRMYLATRESI
jgi:hypothetical protein